MIKKPSLESISRVLNWLVYLICYGLLFHASRKMYLKGYTVEMEYAAAVLFVAGLWWYELRTAIRDTERQLQRDLSDHQRNLMSSIWRSK